MKVLGIDIGGSGIKGAPVDTEKGELVAERHRIPTPHPATPEAVAAVVGEIARHFSWTGPVGCAFPGVVKNGVVKTAANVDDSWIGEDAATRFGRSTGCPVVVLNDADAAGIAEATFGAGRGQHGVMLMLTLGTGIGSAVFRAGQLVPNTELGHLVVKGKEAEKRASDRTRKEKDLGWKDWARQLNKVLAELEALLWPDRIVLGGGVSSKFEKFAHHLRCQAHLEKAHLENEAGIVGAALARKHLLDHRDEPVARIERRTGAGRSRKSAPRKASRSRSRS